MGEKTGKRRSGLWWKIVVGGMLFLLVAVSVLAVKFDAIALNFINQALTTYLVDGGELKTIHFKLLTGSCELGGLSISQPAYAQAPVVKLDRFTVKIDPTTLFSDNFVVEKVAINDLAVSLIRDKNGNLNIEKLLIEPTDDKQPTAPEEKSEVSLPPVWVKSIEVKNFVVHVVDALTKKQWTAHIRIDLSVNDLQLRDIIRGDVQLGKIILALSQLAVDQPSGFGSDKLLTMDKLTVEADSLNLLSNSYNVKNIVLDGFSSSIVVHPDGVSNFQQLVTSLTNSPKKKSTEATKPAAGQLASTTDSDSDLPHIHFEKIVMQQGSLQLRDEAVEKVPLELSLNKISVVAESLNLFSKKTDVKPAALTASFELNQPDGFPTAYFGSFAKVGSLNDGIPPLNAQVRLIGLKLDTLGTLFPATVRTAIGASGLDAGAALSLKPDSIKLHARVLTDQNIVYDAINVQGDLSNPKIEVGAIMAGFGRVTSGIFNLGKDGLSSGYDIAKTGVDITKEAGSGVYHLGKNLGENLFKTGSGLVTFNAGKVKEGVAGTTGGSISLTEDAIRGTGSTTGAGLSSSMSSLRGENSVTAWDNAIPERYQAALTQAQTALSQMAYPPQTD